MGISRERARQLTLGHKPLKPIVWRQPQSENPERIALVEKVLILGRDEKKSTKEIASSCGVPHKLAYSILAGLVNAKILPNLPRRRRGVPNPRSLFREEIYRLLIEEDLTLKALIKRVSGATYSLVQAAVFPAKTNRCPCCHQQIKRGTRKKHLPGSATQKGHSPECAVGIWQSRGEYRHWNGAGKWLEFERLSPDEIQEFSIWLKDTRKSLGLTLRELAGYLDQVGWEPSPCKSGSVSNYENGHFSDKEHWAKRRVQFKAAFALAREEKEK
jgi:hypothetical protein